MAINNRFPMGAAPQDPRKKRPLSPLEDYPYEPEVFDPSTAPRPLPDLPMPTGGAMAVPPITPGLNRPGGPENFPYTPPRDFTQFRQYYTGQPVTPVGPDEVMPPAPDWGKKTPSYSRMNPPPPKQASRMTAAPATPVAPRSPIMRPATPSPVAGKPPLGLQQRRNYLDTGWLDTFKDPEAQMAAQEPLKPGTTATISPQELRRPTAPSGGQGQVLRPGTTARVSTTAPVASSRFASPEERQLLTEAMLSRGKFDEDVSNQLQKERTQRQVAAERARIPESIGGQIAGKMFDTPQGQQVAGQFINRVLRSGSEQVTSIPRGFAALSGSPVALQAVAQDMKPVEGWLAKRFPIDADKKDFLNAVVPQTLGSVAGFMATGAATGGTMLSGSMVGALTNAASTYDEALAAGASHENAVKAARLGSISGSLEGVLGIGRNLRKALQARPLLERAFNIGEEAFQETFTRALDNVNAKIASGYDPQRAWDDGFEEAFLGGLVGGAAVETGGALLQGSARALRTILTRPDGGAEKVPDVVADEASPAGQQYQNWVTQGGVRAPQAWPPPRRPVSPEPSTGDRLYANTVDALPEPAELTGRQALPPATPQLGGRLGLPPAPTRPSAPGATPPPQATPPQPTTTTQPTPPQPAEEEFEGLFRPARPGYLSPKWSPSKAAKGVLYGITGPQEEVALDTQLELERAKYAERMQEFEAGVRRRAPKPPAAKDLKGKYGNIAQAGNKAPVFGMERLKDAYGIPAETNPRDMYGQVMTRIASEMGDIVGRDLTVQEVESAASAQPRTSDISGLWDKWYSKYGADYGLTTEDLFSLEDAAFGKGRGGFFNRPDLQWLLTGSTNEPENNKAVMDAIRKDMAGLLGLPADKYPEISLSRMSPQMWKLWAMSNELDNEGRHPGLMRELGRMIGEGPNLKTRNKDLAPETVDRKTAIPRATTQAPPAPVAPPRPSREGELGRYRGMAQVGVPRAPLSMVPGVPSRRQGPGYQLLPGGRTATTGRPQGPTEPLGGPPALRGVPPTTPPPAGRGPSRVGAFEARSAPLTNAERAFGEALAKKYGAPVAPISQMQEPYGDLSRYSNMLERAARKSTDSAELNRILDSAKGLADEGRVAWEIMSNPATSEKVFNKAKGNAALARTTPDSAIDSIAAKRAVGATPPPAGAGASEAAERQAERQRREALKKRSPFAAVREQEQARATTPTRRAPAPTAAPKPTIAPTAGKKPVTLKTLEEAGWTQETPLRFTHPDGRVIERDSGSSGRKAGWYSTDTSGNRVYHEDLRGAILAATEGQTAAPAAPVTPPPTEAAAPKPQRAKKQAPAAPTTPAPTPKPEAKATPATKAAEPTPTPTTPTPAPAVEAGKEDGLPSLDEIMELSDEALRARLKALTPDQLIELAQQVKTEMEEQGITPSALMELRDTLSKVTKAAAPTPQRPKKVVEPLASQVDEYAELNARGMEGFREWLETQPVSVLREIIRRQDLDPRGKTRSTTDVARLADLIATRLGERSNRGGGFASRIGAGTAPTPTPAAEAAKPAPVAAVAGEENIATRLQNMPTREAALAFLSENYKSRKALEQLARELDVFVSRGDGVDSLRGKIVAATTGARLGSEAVRGTLATPAPTSAAETGKAETGTRLERFKDGIEGYEVSWEQVVNGNDAFQYAVGALYEDEKDAIFRRRVSLRGTYGGWRWERELKGGLREPGDVQSTPSGAAATPEYSGSVEARRDLEPEVSIDRFAKGKSMSRAMGERTKLAEIYTERGRLDRNLRSHGQIVQEAISQGGTVTFDDSGNRRLKPPDVAFDYTEQQLSPLALDFAEFLLKEKGYVREGDRYVPPSKPKAAPRAAEMETASESDKAIFEDVDANKNKKGAKSRIKQAYGTRGTKAIFIEDNINQILQEAEENGKVTKICPD